ncbi:MAG: hypothetical protein JXB35_05405 [Anaerolineae bacterium]|nr:hypothetical protein [Anaerolineae bacterium]
MPEDDFARTEPHAFIVRIWREPGLTRSDGRILWRGRVQHVASGTHRVFETLTDLLAFIVSCTGALEEPPCE